MDSYPQEGPMQGFLLTPIQASPRQSQECFFRFGGPNSDLIFDPIEANFEAN